MKNWRESIHIGPMTLDDIPQVVAIDRLSFPLPWSADSYRHELTKNEHSHFLVAYTPAAGRGWWAGGRGARRQVVGYIGYWYIVDEAHISTLAVHPQYRGRGLGERLLVEMLKHAETLGATLATLEVRAGNVVAQHLYRKYGFEEVGRRKRYYRDNGEDAVLMTVQPLGRAWEGRRTPRRAEAR